MISLIIPPKDQVSRINKMLTGIIIIVIIIIIIIIIIILIIIIKDEYGTASNIKSRVNRLSVLGAITSTQQRLKLYTRVPGIFVITIIIIILLLLSLLLPLSSSSLYYYYYYYKIMD